MKRNIALLFCWFCCLFIILLPFKIVCSAVELVPMWVHVHSCYSDGEYCPVQLKEIAMSKGYKGIVFTDHSDCFITRWAQLHGYKTHTVDYFIDTPYTHLHPAVNSYSDYYEEINTIINQDGVFVAIPGREITVAKDPRTKNPRCEYPHINVISFEENPYLYDTKYATSDLYKVLGGVLNKRGIISIFNHPKDCREWEDHANMFYGIEVMNDFSPSFAFDKIAKENYQYHLKLYMDSLRKTEMGYFVVGGADFHSDVQWAIGKITTYFFPDEFSQRGVFDALYDARTVATRNLKLIEMNPYPSYENVGVVDKVVISGRVEIPKKYFLNNTLNVYKIVIVNNDSEDFKVAMKEEGSGKDGVVYSFHFEDSGISSKKTRYVLEIPYHMITSPFYFKKGD